VVRLTRAASGLEIRSGGQSGIDRAALDVAIALDVKYAGWCPRGGWAEDFPSPPGVRARFPALRETPSADPRQRTAWNVRDSDATLMLVRGIAWDSQGTTFTRACAELIFEKPFHVQDLQATDAFDRTSRWIASHMTAGKALVLNVAGPRESESPGIYDRSRPLLEKLLRALTRD
jgi:putative molybdenum carrier protein